ncbi:hypothetical protein GIB67_034569 [Kingdonia uniflora]|uniref:Exopolygalacturonase n=1 Tax=Kingdonia uniflora TaxID=39325 RepID=A0A7J7MXQ4_9MAGN|nr:hypothetical protein GIB67_034569 [Kingdonia uniflora]
MGSSSNLLKVCLSVLVFVSTANAKSQSGIFNVVNFGAVADGKTDSAKAFLDAWNQACACDGQGRVVIPRGTFLAGPVSFKGPCKAPIVFQLTGKVIAPEEIQSENWITFDYVTGLNISGGGTFDGRGALTWSRTQCYKGGSCGKDPINIRFNFVTDAAIRGISSVDSKFFHMLVYRCKNVKFFSINISAPALSHNTDGIHIGESTGISITRSFIGTGDDCVSLGPGSENITVSNVRCGPGHGISIGSLGRYDDENPLYGIHVKNCTLTGTDNGIRIKTWAVSPTGHSPPGLASDFIFENIVMDNVANPIIIDQEYCPFQYCNKGSPSCVKISNVSFKDIRGTSKSKLAVKLLCSKGFPCQNVELSDINLQYTGTDGPATSMCTNVDAKIFGNVFPSTCV